MVDEAFPETLFTTTVRYRLATQFDPTRVGLLGSDTASIRETVAVVIDIPNTARDTSRPGLDSFFAEGHLAPWVCRVLGLRDSQMGLR